MQLVLSRTIVLVLLVCVVQGARIKKRGQNVNVDKVLKEAADENVMLHQNATWGPYSQEATESLLANMNEGDPKSYIPSPIALWFSKPAATDVVADLADDKAYSRFFPHQYTGDGKVLVYATSKYLLETKNGKFFNTGHHTSEFLLPLHHIMAAGFTNIDIATKDGGRVALEKWTFPLATGYEDVLRETQEQVKDKLESPMQINQVSPNLDGYIAIFMPGGHGPLIEMGKDPVFGALLRKAHEKKLPLISLCHGPNALRSAALGGEFPFVGYRLAVFPDSTDDSSPGVGYLPGYLKDDDFAEANLKKLGMHVVNTEMDDMVVQDRELITGASQKSAHKLGKVAVQALLSKYA